MLLSNFSTSVTRKYGRACQEMIDNRSQGIYIGRGLWRLAEQLLWRASFSPRQRSIPGLILAVHFKQTSHTNVRYHQLPIKPDENSVHGKITMENSMLMSIFQSG